MAELQQEPQGTMHTYLSRAWYRDTQTWYLLGAFAFFLIGDQEFMKGAPLWIHHVAEKVIIAGALWARFQSGTRPVALREGAPREVSSIPPQTLKENTV